MISFKKPNGAIFSSDRRYRYILWRSWNRDEGSIMFVGLNPSTANEGEDDPTIRRVIRFAKDWGYGGVIMCNLFGLVSSDPKLLDAHPDPIGNNDLYLGYGNGCSKVIFAWGNFKQARERAKVITRMFPDALALQINKNGSPKHPLYVRADVQPVPYRSINHNSITFSDESSSKI